MTNGSNTQETSAGIYKTDLEQLSTAMEKASVVTGRKERQEVKEISISVMGRLSKDSGMMTNFLSSNTRVK